MVWDNAVEDYIVNSSVPAEKAGNAIVHAAVLVRNSFSMIENASCLSAVDIALRIKTIRSCLEELTTIRDVLNHFGFEDGNVANSTNSALVSLSAVLVDAQSTLKCAWMTRAETEAGF